MINLLTNLLVAPFRLIAFLARPVVIGFLGRVGFGPAGPIAGSIASLIQSTLGNVAAGSLFAMAQSLTMRAALITGFALLL